MWGEMILALRSGYYSFVLSEALEHNLATSNKIEVITPVMLPILLAEHNLVDIYQQNHTIAVLELAKRVNAQGVILITAEGIEPTRRELQASVQLSAQLIDVESKAIVMSSKIADSSMFSNVRDLIAFNATKLMSDLDKAFIKLNAIQ